MSDEELFKLALTRIQQLVPKFKVRAKKDVWWQRLIGFFMSKSYMTSFWTTVGFTAYYPGDSPRWDTMLHEGLHAVQASRWTRPVFFLLYAMPQILAIPGALTLLGLWWFGQLAWWYSLLPLVLLAPVPAYFRMRWEYAAYSVTLAVDYWQRGGLDGDLLGRLQNYFRGGSYYYMWPFRRGMAKRLGLTISDLLSQEFIAQDKYHKMVYDVLVTAGKLTKSSWEAQPQPQ